MEEATRVTFAGGRNIAMKVPPHQWEATVAFYRDTVGLPTFDHDPTTPPSVGFIFGGNRLWIDRVESVSHAELWLELTTEDVPGAAAYLDAAGVVRRDEIEPLPEDHEGFWIANPASIIHMVARPEAS
jgi:hypothetical protein